MAQHDMNIANQGFPATRADLNNALQALVSNSSGATAPSTTFANQWWYDTTNNKMYLRNEANNAWIEVFALDQTNNEWQLVTGQISAADGDGIAFKTDDGTTRVTLDDDGNLLVNTTTQQPASTSGVEGFSVYAGGQVQASKSGAAVARFNRNSSDGTIADFRKDGTTVGSIGVEGGDLVVDGGSAHAGIRFLGATVRPRDNGAVSDGGVDLGASNGRWNDLYLSGGAYLGGTTSANYLTDYEEGSWSASLDGSTTAGTITFSSNVCRYTKIGRMVHIKANLIFNTVSGATGTWRFQGLPFAPSSVNNSGGRGNVSFSNVDYDPATYNIINCYVSTSPSRLQLLGVRDNAGWVVFDDGDITFSSGDTIALDIIYFT